MQLKKILLSATLSTLIAYLVPQSLYGQEVKPLQNGQTVQKQEELGRYDDGTLTWNMSGRGKVVLHNFRPYNIIQRQWGLMIGKHPVYSSSVDFNRDGHVSLEEKIDQDNDKNISDKEVEEWFLRNMGSITPEDRKRITSLFIDGLSYNDSYIGGGDSIFPAKVVEKLDPEAAQEKLDELFSKASWGFGTTTGYEMLEVSNFGNLGVEACIKYSNGNLNQRKTAMESLRLLMLNGVSIDGAVNTIVDRFLNDSDSYVRHLAGVDSLGFNKEQCLRLVKDKNPQVRAITICPLSNYYEDKGVKEYLDRLVDDKEENDLVRIQAILWPEETEQRYGGLIRKLNDHSESQEFRRKIIVDGISFLLFQQSPKCLKVEEFKKLMTGIKYVLDNEKNAELRKPIKYVMERVNTAYGNGQKVGDK